MEMSRYQKALVPSGLSAPRLAWHRRYRPLDCDDTRDIVRRMLAISASHTQAADRNFVQ